jgi:serpin B
MSNPQTRGQRFADRIHARILSDEPDRNLVISSLSIDMALALCAAGASGETRDVLVDLLGAPDDLDAQNRKYCELLRSIDDGEKRPYRLAMANALWAARGCGLRPEFADMATDSYDAVVREVDFAGRTDEAIAAINRWAADKTQGNITELVNADLIRLDTRLVLTNAIHFKATWETKFDPNRTRNETWFGRTRRTVPLMMLKNETLLYEDDELQAVSLPYAGRHMAMLVVLPRKKDGLPDIERRWLRDDLFGTITAGLDPETAIVHLPRFKVESGSLLLKPVLCALRADLPFTAAADFSGIAEEPLQIGEVVHKAFVEVDEVGTEAAAATAVIMMRSTGAGSRPSPPIVFRADHPFLFFVWSRKTGTVFFSGRVVEP